MTINIPEDATVLTGTTEDGKLTVTVVAQDGRRDTYKISNAESINFTGDTERAFGISRHADTIQDFADSKEIQIQVNGTEKVDPPEYMDADDIARAEALAAKLGIDVSLIYENEEVSEFIAYNERTPVPPQAFLDFLREHDSELDDFLKQNKGALSEVGLVTDDGKKVARDLMNIMLGYIETALGNEHWDFRTQYRKTIKDTSRRYADDRYIDNIQFKRSGNHTWFHAHVFDFVDAEGNFIVEN